MSHFKAFSRKHHWGSSSSDIHEAPLPRLPTVGPSSALGPRQPCESWLMTCGHKGFWAHGPCLGNLKLFQPPGFWWLLRLAERGGERVSWQESRRYSAGAPARWVKITIPFPEWAIFNGKLVLSEFFCPALPCELLVLVLRAPTLPCGPAILPSLRVPWTARSPVWCTHCISEVQEGDLSGRNGASSWELSNGKGEPGVTEYSSCSTQESLHQHFQLK